MIKLNRKVNKRSIVKNQVKPVDKKKNKKNQKNIIGKIDLKYLMYLMRKERNEKSKKYFNDNKEMIRIKKEEKAKYEKSLEKKLSYELEFC